MKTKIVTKSVIDGIPKGSEGYIDGYVRGADDRPYAAIVVGNQIVYAMFYDLLVIE